MDSYVTVIQHYLDLYRNGKHDVSFHGLLEQDTQILPHLIEAYKLEPDAKVRCFLVEVMWQHRDFSIIPFLAEALGDEAPEVWKQALDGLVTLASPAARQVLCDAQVRLQSRKDMHTCLNEALEQVDEALAERRD